MARCYSGHGVSPLLLMHNPDVQPSEAHHPGLPPLLRDAYHTHSRGALALSVVIVPSHVTICRPPSLPPSQCWYTSSTARTTSSPFNTTLSAQTCTRRQLRGNNDECLRPAVWSLWQTTLPFTGFLLYILTANILQLHAWRSTHVPLSQKEVSID